MLKTTYPHYYKHNTNVLARLYRVRVAGEHPQVLSVICKDWQNSIFYYTEEKLRKEAKRITARAAAQFELLAKL